MRSPQDVRVNLVLALSWNKSPAFLLQSEGSSLAISSSVRMLSIVHQMVYRLSVCSCNSAFNITRIDCITRADEFLFSIAVLLRVPMT